METYYRYDAHCHIFTLKYALKELRNMLHDMLQRTYPWKEPTNKLMLSSDKGAVWDILKELLRQLYELIHAAGGSEAENLDFLQVEAGKAFPDSTLRIVPLMMDIFYMLAYPMDKGQDIKTVKGLNAAIEVDKDEFQVAWNEILDDFTSYLESKRVSNKLATEISSSNDLIELALQLIEDERSVKGTLIMKSNVTNGYSDSRDFYHTDGYCYHMDNLMDLVKTRNKELFPFVAIDPRRPDIIKTLLSGAFMEGDSRFYGVKLYPRMGYHPQCKPMDDLYKFCSNNNLPITFHCGKGGFPPITTPKRRDFGKPENFEPVIQKYPDLKIDFAHLGSSDKTHEWAKKIVEMIDKYDNVFSDLSCYTHKKDLDYVKENYWDKYPKLKTRLMFGTDFDVMYFTGIITMQNYYGNFKNTFSADELKVLMHDNPMRFMNIP